MELQRLGHAYSGAGNLNDEEAYKIGLKQYIVQLNVLSEIFKNDPDLRNNTIIVVSNKSTDGASGLNDTQMEATRRAIYQLSDMIYSPNPNDIDYFIGERTDTPEELKRKYGSLKPCIHGCDAHENSKIFMPDQNRFCWIKADPTFEGFKQILYEPKDRVRICSAKPEEKPQYHTIDKVEILNNDDFNPCPIYFNDKLTCIIGGKSTGKSLLLHNIARTIDSKQVDYKCTIDLGEKNNSREKAFTKVRPLTNIKVYWSDGKIESATDPSKDKRKIVYIPQTYLNRLSDEREETTEIDKIIEEIILQNTEASVAFNIKKEDLVDLKKVILRDVVDFVQISNSIYECNKQKMEIGSFEGIQSEIEKLNLELETISKNYSISTEDFLNHQQAVEKLREFNLQIASLKEEQAYLEKTLSVVDKKDFQYNKTPCFKEKVVEAIDQTLLEANNIWLNKRAGIVEDIVKKVEDIFVQVVTYTDIEKELMPKMQGHEQIEKISHTINLEKEKLENIRKLDEKLAVHQNKYEQLITDIATSFSKFRIIYDTFAQTINENIELSNSELFFNVEVVFRKEHFLSKIGNIIDNRTFPHFKNFSLNNDISNELNENDLNLNSLKDLIRSIMMEDKSSLQIKKDYSKDNVLRDIFDDWFNINYVVKMDDDTIYSMSPGKRALVLLRLLISLAESKYPILIDQPEDDLDNRSIFDELISFVKAKKIDRQIIVVTHNANIVLGGDAEQVIVANQHGKNAPNNKYKFEYRSGSIENNLPVKENNIVLNGILNQQGIQAHICAILEGGERAFDLRKNKYRFTNF